MKPISFLLTGVTVLLLAFAACTDGVPEVRNSTLKQIVITASDFEVEEGSRTNFHITSSGAEFSWAANDTVGIFPNEGAQAYFPMISGAGAKTANFDGGGWALRDASVYAAYYPFIGDFYLDKNAIPVNYAGQVQTGNASTTHLGAYDFMAAVPVAPQKGSVNFAFKHLGALVQLQLTLPEAATINTVALTAETEAFAVKGKVDIMASAANIIPSECTTALTLHVRNVTTTDANQVVTLYMMLPPTDLSDQIMKAVVSTNKGIAEIPLESRNFQAGKAYALKGKFEGAFTLETDYVDLLFDAPNVSVSYNEYDGSLTVNYPAGKMPSVRVGNSMVLPAEYGFDIRVIDYVSTSGNTLTMQTSQGNMSNLFRNTSFTLTSDPSVASRSTGSNVYTPSAYGYIDENGEYVEVYNEATTSRKVYPLNQNFWEFCQDFNGDKIYEGEAGKLYWDKCEFNAGLKGTFTFDFGEKEIDEVRKIGDLKKFGYKLTGNIGMDLLLHYEYEYEYYESEDGIIKENVIPTKYIKFMVGTVPVVILVDTHLGKFTECHIRGSLDSDDEESTKILDATAGVKLGTEVSIGMEWTPGSGVIPTREIEPTFELYPFAVEARGYAETKVSYYPQIAISIYKFLGPWIETRSYLKEKVDAGFRYSADGDNNYIGWKAETYNGMDLRMGLDLDFGFWDKEVWTSDIYNCVKDRLLFEAPSRIRILSPDNNIKVEKGDSVKVELIVESFSPLTSQYYPCPLALVNISSERGELDKKVAITNVEGRVSLNWIPNPKNDEIVSSRATSFGQHKLLAKVVDKDGKSIDESTLSVKSDDEVYELLELIYKQTNGDKWQNNDNWLTDAPIEEWYGVTINPETGKLRLELGSNGLRGYIDLSELDRNTNSEYDWIEYLDCSLARIQTLNLSNCKSLQTLNCGGAGTGLTSKLDVSGCTNLEEIIFKPNEHYAIFHKFETINASDCISLKRIINHITADYLKSVDFSNCISLEKMNLYAPELSDLNVTGCKSLNEFRCVGSKIARLDIKSCFNLEILQVVSNHQLHNLDISGMVLLKELDLRLNNNLKTLNASGCTSLTNCSIGDVEDLNVSNCTALEWLGATISNLKNINVQGCTSLKILYCNDGQLTSLDVSGLTKLESLICSYNKIENLNISGCISLKELRCDNNNIVREITDWFSQLTTFIYDQRYRYTKTVYNNGVLVELEYVDNGIGWWYPGEPQKGYHERN